MNCGSGHRIHFGRRHDRTNDDHGVVVGWLIPAGNGEFRTSFDLLHTEATSGHLRMARRGDTWFAMFAENDSSAYQLVGQQKLEGSENQPAVFEMQSIATDGGTSHVVWKDLQIAAEKFVSSFNLVKVIEGWGDFEDPTGATKIEVRDGVLSITTPAILTDNYPPGAVNAPRVTQEVSGDFTADVKVLHLDEAKPNSVFKSIGDFPAYHAATLLIRLDDKNCVRFERVSMHRDTTLSTLCVLQMWENTASTMYESVPVDDTVTNLRVERIGAVLRSSYSQDNGKTWTRMGDCKLKALAGKVSVGLSMTNNTDPGSVVRFRDFQIIRRNTSP